LVWRTPGLQAVGVLAWRVALSNYSNRRNPQFSPSFCCDGPMARPVWPSRVRVAQRSVGYACAALGRESPSSRVGKQPTVALGFNQY